MSNPNEEEKLTPGLGKSYDGDSIPMAEDNEKDIHEKEDNDPDNETETVERATQEKRSELMDVIRKLFNSDAIKSPSTEAEGNEAASFIRALVDFTAAKKNSPDNHSEKTAVEMSAEEKKNAEIAVAEFAFLCANPEKLTPNDTTEDVVDGDVEDVNGTIKLYDALFEAAEGAGLDRESIAEHVAKIIKTEEPVQTDTARSEKFEELLMKHLQRSSSEALAVLQVDLRLLNEHSENSETKEAAGNAAMLLKEILKDVELLDAEELPHDESEFDRKFAQLIVLAFESYKEHEKPLKQVSEKASSLTQQEEEEAELMMNLLLSPNDTKENKQKIIAAALKEYYPVKEKGDKNEEMRTFIKTKAELSGLSWNEIELEESVVGIEFGEERDEFAELGLPQLNAFERLVEKQIMAAEPADVKIIQNTWREVLRQADPDSELAATAKNAIKVLGDIITFKEAVEQAKQRGERINPHALPKPLFMYNEEQGTFEEDEPRSEKKQLSLDKARAKLIDDLVRLFLNAETATSAENTKIIKYVTWLVVHSPDFDREKIEALIACLPKVDGKDPEAIRHKIAAVWDVAKDNVAHIDPYAVSGTIPEEDRQQKLESIFTESVSDASIEQLRKTSKAWKDMLEDTDWKSPYRRRVADAVEQIETILTANKEVSRESLIETDVQQTADYAEVIQDTLASFTQSLDPQEAKAIDILVLLTTAQSLRTDAKQGSHDSERTIKTLLDIFSDNQTGIASNEALNAIRGEILDFADKKLHLDITKVWVTDEVSTTKQTLQDLITDRLGTITSEEVRSLQTLWLNTLKTEGDNRQLQEGAQQAVEILGKVAEAREAVAKGEQYDPTIIFEQQVANDGTVEEEISGPLAETKKHIKTLEDSLAAIDNEALQTHLQELVDKMKKGLTPEEINVEFRKLNAVTGEVKRRITGDSRTRDERAVNEAEQLKKINQAIKPFSDFLLSSQEDGISAIEMKKEQDLSTEAAEGKTSQEIQYLVEDIAKIENVAMQQYLKELMTQFSRGMTPDEMDAALNQLDEVAQKVTEQMGSALRNENTGTMKDKVTEVLAFEANINNYRKFLIRAKQREMEETLPETGAEKQSSQTRAFIDETTRINELERFDELSIDTFKKYIKDLSTILKNPQALSPDQIDAAYIALETQEIILRGNLLQANNFTEAVALFQKGQHAQMLLYGQLARIHKDDVDYYSKSFEELALNKARMHDAFAGVATGYDRPLSVGYIPDPESGRPVHAFIDDAVEKIKTQATPALRLPTGLDPRFEREMRSDIDDLQKREVYADEAELLIKQKKLTGMIENDMVSGRPPSEWREARMLAEEIHRQRLALLAKSGYTGVLEKTAERDESLYPKFVHQALGERMRRLRVAFGAEAPSRPQDSTGYSEKQLNDYYKELSRWARILLSNDVTRNPDRVNDPSVLRLSTDQLRRFGAIIQRETTPQSIRSQSGVILNDIDFMLNQGDFLSYFMDPRPDPENQEDDPRLNPDKRFNPNKRLGVPYQRPQEMKEGGYGIPESLQDLMKLIADSYSKTNKGLDYRTGGNRELIDAEGNFQYHNFYFWIRNQSLEDIEYNKDGQINPFGKIIVKLPLGQISLFEMLLLIPEYLSERRFTINQDRTTGEISSGWGDKVENSGLKWEAAGNIAAEMEFRQMFNDLRVKFQDTGHSGDKKGYLEIMKALHSNFHMARANNLLLLLGLPSVTGGTQEFDDWYGPKEKQGRLGNAKASMITAYYYISEISDYNKMRDPVTKKEREKEFNENMFYKFWEPNGANLFLTKMAEGALNKHVKAKELYSRFIEKRLEAAARGYMGRASAAQQAQIMQHMQEWKQQLARFRSNNVAEGDASVSINFTQNEHLENFHTYVLGAVFDEAIDDQKKSEISRQVKESLLDNLKDEYFSLLVDMQVGKIATGKKYNKKTKKWEDNKERADAHRNYMIDGTIRFGSIVLDDGQTMEDFLNSFDVQQIKRFDYLNGDVNDPIVMAGARTETEMRDALDRFMDPRRNPDNHKLFKQNEKMMLAFTKHITNIERKWINHFRDVPESEDAKVMVRDAFQACVTKLYGIDPMEAKYGWYWVRDYVYLWGIGAYLDKQIGFRYDGKIINTGQWLSHRGGKDGGGNKDLMPEVNALSLDFLHALRVRDRDNPGKLGNVSAFSLLQGGEGGYIKPRAIREFKHRTNGYKIEHDDEGLYVENNIANACDLVDLLASIEIKFNEVIDTDAFGNVRYHYDKAREIFKSLRKPIRYALQKNGLDYREVIWANGKETSLYEHFFGKKTRALNELIRRETNRTIDDMFKEPADALMMSIIAAEVYDHRKMFSKGYHWTMKDVIELMHVLIDFMEEDDLTTDENGDPKHVHAGRPLTQAIFNSSLKAYHTGFARMYASELGTSFFGSIGAGISASIKAFFKGKWIY